VIQEAAHEDANIIFGAVVDPALEGRVKITVIATGFERKSAVRETSAALQTPTDLSNYTAHLNRIALESREAALDALEARTAHSTPPPAMPHAPVTLSRRPALELSLPLAGVAASGGNGHGAGDAMELDSPFDVPAFLRRQS
jgi:cell division protein FtsZ